MNMNTLFKHRLGALFFFFLGLCQMGIAQKQMEVPYKPHLYASILSFSSRDYSSVEQNPLFKEGYVVTMELGLLAGYQLNEAIGFELAYLNRRSTISNSFGENEITSVYGVTDIRTVSFSVLNSLSLIPRRLFVKPKIGYVAGWHGLSENNETSVGTTTNADLYTSTKLTALNGGRLDFILLGLALELNVSKRISCSLGYMRHQGIKNLAMIETEYEYQGERGEVQSISNGTIGGVDLSFKFRFIK